MLSLAKDVRINIQDLGKRRAFWTADPGACRPGGLRQPSRNGLVALDDRHRVAALRGD